MVAQEMSHEDALTHYTKLLKDLLMVCQLSGIQQWPQLQEFLQHFAKQSPGAVARSALHAAIKGGHRNADCLCSAHQNVMHCNSFLVSAAADTVLEQLALIVDAVGSFDDGPYKATTGTLYV